VSERADAPTERGTDDRPSLEAGMDPYEMLVRGESRCRCLECGRLFATWDDAHDHQEDAHDGWAGIGIDDSNVEPWIDETRVFTWDVDGHRVERDLFSAALYVDQGRDVRLAADDEEVSE